jgi:hypothetical protein
MQRVSCPAEWSNWVARDMFVSCVCVSVCVCVCVRVRAACQRERAANAKLGVSVLLVNAT